MQHDLGKIRLELDAEYRYLGGVNAEAVRSGAAWLATLTDELKKKLYTFWKQIEAESANPPPC